MRKLILVGLMGIALLISGCGTRMGGAAGVTDANSLYNTSSSAQASGLGPNDNLVGQDVGPHEGILNKRSFYFDFDSDTVHPDDVAAIQAHGQYLLKHPNARILLEGNADVRGSREYNIALGQRRANAVSRILLMQGVPRNQVRTISYGAEKPAALGHTEADYQLNRRVDIRYEAN